METFWFFYLRFAYDSNSDSYSVDSENHPSVANDPFYHHSMSIGSSSRSARPSSCTFTHKLSRVRVPFPLFPFMRGGSVSIFRYQSLFIVIGFTTTVPFISSNNYCIPEHSIAFGFPLPYISLNALKTDSLEQIETLYENNITSTRL